MHMRKSIAAVMAIALNSLSPAVFGQGPAGDTVVVTFDRPVQVGSQTLPPGDYTVRQVTSASNPRVLEFTTGNGTQLHATVTAIPIMQNVAPTETKVILDNDNRSGSLRLSRIWVQGKNYGYEIPGNNTTAMQSSPSLNLEARFDVARPDAAVQVATAPVESPVVAQNRPVETPTPEPTAAPAPASDPTPSPATTPAAEPTSNPEPAPVPQTPQPKPERPAATPVAGSDIPSTALGWAQFVFAGLLFAGAGIFLYWRQERGTI